MIESRNFTVLLGSATNDPSTVASGKAVAAATREDMKVARQDLAPGSLDHLDIVLNANDLASLYDPMDLAGWVKCLQEGATVSVTVQGDESIPLQAIHSSFVLAGLKGASERREYDGSRVFTAMRPSALKSSSAVALGAKPIALANKKSAAVSISLDDEDDEDLIDEDGLLSGDGLAPPPAMEATATAGDDCGGRTACDNCTCGRSEQEAGAKKQPAAKKSSCGKCGLGDAFRCASCPYLGMPAFKPGDEPVLLDLQDDIDL